VGGAQWHLVKEIVALYPLFHVAPDYCRVVEIHSSSEIAKRTLSLALLVRSAGSSGLELPLPLRTPSKSKNAQTSAGTCHLSLVKTRPRANVPEEAKNGRG